MDCKFYREIFGKLPGNRTVSHECIPCHNLFSQDLLKYLSKSFEHSEDLQVFSKNSHAFPFYKDFIYVTEFSTVFFPGSGLKDRANDLVTQKLIWEKKLSQVMPKAKDHRKVLNYLRKGKTGKISRHDLTAEKYLKHFKTDPEPYFQGDYNWLYTGGNISGFNFNNKYCLITGNEINNSSILNVIELQLDDRDKFGESIEKQTHYLAENDPVLQVSSCQCANDIIFAVRQKKCFNLMKLNENYFIESSWMHKVEKGIYVCADISADPPLFVTLDNFSEMTLYDVGKEKYLLKQKYNFGSGPWAQIMFYGNNGTCIYIATPDSVNIIDLRVPLKPELVYKPKIIGDDCEFICNVIRRKYTGNSFVVATSHKALEVDIRTGKNTQAWTHLMNSPPQFGNSSYRKGEEIIILQSENPEETVGIINEKINEELESISQYNPYIFDSVKEERRRAVLRDAGTHPAVKERLNFTITGLEVFTNSRDEPFVFIVNGGGDVIVNKLKRRGDGEKRDEFNVSEEALKGFRKFDEHCLNLYANKTSVDSENLIDMSAIKKGFNPDKPKRIKVKNKERIKKLKWRYAEMYTPESLCYHQDYIAEHVMHVWKIKKRNIWDIDLLTEDERKKEEEVYQKLDKEKINMWIASMEGPDVKYDL